MIFQTHEHLDLIRCVPAVTTAKTAHFYWILSVPDLVQCCFPSGGLVRVDTMHLNVSEIVQTCLIL